MKAIRRQLDELLEPPLRLQKSLQITRLKEILAFSVSESKEAILLWAHEANRPFLYRAQNVMCRLLNLDGKKPTKETLQLLIQDSSSLQYETRKDVALRAIGEGIATTSREFCRRNPSQQPFDKIKYLRLVDKLRELDTAKKYTDKINAYAELAERDKRLKVHRNKQTRENQLRIQESPLEWSQGVGQPMAQQLAAAMKSGEEYHDMISSFIPSSPKVFDVPDGWRLEYGNENLQNDVDRFSDNQSQAMRELGPLWGVLGYGLGEICTRKSEQVPGVFWSTRKTHQLTKLLNIPPEKNLATMLSERDDRSMDLADEQPSAYSNAYHTFMQLSAFLAEWVVSDNAGELIAPELKLTHGEFKGNGILLGACGFAVRSESDKEFVFLTTSHISPSSLCAPLRVMQQWLRLGYATMCTRDTFGQIQNEQKEWDAVKRCVCVPCDYWISQSVDEMARNYASHLRIVETILQKAVVVTPEVVTDVDKSQSASYAMDLQEDSIHEQKKAQIEQEFNSFASVGFSPRVVNGRKRKPDELSRERDAAKRGKSNAKRALFSQTGSLATMISEHRTLFGTHNFSQLATFAQSVICWPYRLEQCRSLWVSHLRSTQILHEFAHTLNDAFVKWSIGDPIDESEVLQMTIRNLTPTERHVAVEVLNKIGLTASESKTHEAVLVSIYLGFQLNFTLVSALTVDANQELSQLSFNASRVNIMSVPPRRAHKGQQDTGVKIFGYDVADSKRDMGLAVPFVSEEFLHMDILTNIPEHFKKINGFPSIEATQMISAMSHITNLTTPAFTIDPVTFLPVEDNSKFSGIANSTYLDVSRLKNKQYDRSDVLIQTQMKSLVALPANETKDFEDSVAQALTLLGRRQENVSYVLRKAFAIKAGDKGATASADSWEILYRTIHKTDESEDIKGLVESFKTNVLEFMIDGKLTSTGSGSTRERDSFKLEFRFRLIHEFLRMYGDVITKDRKVLPDMIVGRAGNRSSNVYQYAYLLFALPSIWEKFVTARYRMKEYGGIDRLVVAAACRWSIEKEKAQLPDDLCLLDYTSQTFYRVRERPANAERDPPVPKYAFIMIASKVLLVANLKQTVDLQPREFLSQKIIQVGVDSVTQKDLFDRMLAMALDVYHTKSLEWLTQNSRGVEEQIVKFRIISKVHISRVLDLPIFRWVIIMWREWMANLHHPTSRMGIAVALLNLNDNSDIWDPERDTSNWVLTDDDLERASMLASADVTHYENLTTLTDSATVGESSESKASNFLNLHVKGQKMSKLLRAIYGKREVYVPKTSFFPSVKDTVFIDPPLNLAKKQVSGMERRQAITKIESVVSIPEIDALSVIAEYYLAMHNEKSGFNEETIKKWMTFVGGMIPFRLDSGDTALPFLQTDKIQNIFDKTWLECEKLVYGADAILSQKERKDSPINLGCSQCFFSCKNQIELKINSFIGHPDSDHDIQFEFTQALWVDWLKFGYKPKLPDTVASTLLTEHVLNQSHKGDHPNLDQVLKRVETLLTKIDFLESLEQVQATKHEVHGTTFRACLITGLMKIGVVATAEPRDIWDKFISDLLESRNLDTRQELFLVTLANLEKIGRDEVDDEDRDKKYGPHLGSGFVPNFDGIDDDALFDMSLELSVKYRAPNTLYQANFWFRYAPQLYVLHKGSINLVSSLRIALAIKNRVMPFIPLRTDFMANIDNRQDYDPVDAKKTAVQNFIQPGILSIVKSQASHEMRWIWTEIQKVMNSNKQPKRDQPSLLTRFKNVFKQDRDPTIRPPSHLSTEQLVEFLENDVAQAQAVDDFFGSRRLAQPTQKLSYWSLSKATKFDPAIQFAESSTGKWPTRLRLLLKATNNLFDTAVVRAIYAQGDPELTSERINSLITRTCDLLQTGASELLVEVNTAIEKATIRLITNNGKINPSHTTVDDNLSISSADHLAVMLRAFHIRNAVEVFSAFLKFLVDFIQSTKAVANNPIQQEFDSKFVNPLQSLNAILSVHGDSDVKTQAPQQLNAPNKISPLEAVLFLSLDDNSQNRLSALKTVINRVAPPPSSLAIGSSREPDTVFFRGRCLSGLSWTLRTQPDKETTPISSSAPLPSDNNISDTGALLQQFKEFLQLQSTQLDTNIAPISTANKAQIESAERLIDKFRNVRVPTRWQQLLEIERVKIKQINEEEKPNRQKIVLVAHKLQALQALCLRQKKTNEHMSCQIYQLDRLYNDTVALIKEEVKTYLDLSRKMPTEIIRLRLLRCKLNIQTYVAAFIEALGDMIPNFDPDLSMEATQAEMLLNVDETTQLDKFVATAEETYTKILQKQTLSAQNIENLVIKVNQRLGSLNNKTRNDILVNTRRLQYGPIEGYVAQSLQDTLQSVFDLQAGRTTINRLISEINARNIQMTWWKLPLEIILQGGILLPLQNWAFEDIPQIVPRFYLENVQGKFDLLTKLAKGAMTSLGSLFPSTTQRAFVNLLGKVDSSNPIAVFVRNIGPGIDRAKISRIDAFFKIIVGSLEDLVARWKDIEEQGPVLEKFCNSFKSQPNAPFHIVYKTLTDDMKTKVLQPCWNIAQELWKSSPVEAQSPIFREVASVKFFSFSKLMADAELNPEKFKDVVSTVKEMCVDFPAQEFVDTARAVQSVGGKQTVFDVISGTEKIFKNSDSRGSIIKQMKQEWSQRDYPQQQQGRAESPESSFNFAESLKTLYFLGKTAYFLTDYIPSKAFELGVGSSWPFNWLARGVGQTLKAGSGVPELVAVCYGLLSQTKGTSLEYLRYHALPLLLPTTPFNLLSGPGLQMFRSVWHLSKPSASSSKEIGHNETTVSLPFEGTFHWKSFVSMLRLIYCVDLILPNDWVLSNLGEQAFMAKSGGVPTDLTSYFLNHPYKVFFLGRTRVGFAADAAAYLGSWNRYLSKTFTRVSQINAGSTTSEISLANRQPVILPSSALRFSVSRTGVIPMASLATDQVIADENTRRDLINQLIMDPKKPPTRVLLLVNSIAKGVTSINANLIKEIEKGMERQTGVRTEVKVQFINELIEFFKRNKPDNATNDDWVASCLNIDPDIANANSFCATVLDNQKSGMSLDEIRKDLIQIATATTPSQPESYEKIATEMLNNPDAKATIVVNSSLESTTGNLFMFINYGISQVPNFLGGPVFFGDAMASILFDVFMRRVTGTRADWFGDVALAASRFAIIFVPFWSLYFTTLSTLPAFEGLTRLGFSSYYGRLLTSDLVAKAMKLKRGQSDPLTVLIQGENLEAFTESERKLAEILNPNNYTSVTANEASYKKNVLTCVVLDGVQYAVAPFMSWSGLYNPNKFMGNWLFGQTLTNPLLLTVGAFDLVALNLAILKLIHTNYNAGTLGKWDVAKALTAIGCVSTAAVTLTPFLTSLFVPIAKEIVLKTLEYQDKGRFATPRKEQSRWRNDGHIIVSSELRTLFSTMESGVSWRLIPMQTGVKTHPTGPSAFVSSEDKKDIITDSAEFSFDDIYELNESDDEWDGKEYYQTVLSNGKNERAMSDAGDPEQLSIFEFDSTLAHEFHLLDVWSS